MANFYTDTPELKFHLNHPLMKRIVELKERNFTEKDKYDYAPLDFEDTMDSYDKVLEIVGEICGDIIAPNAEGVDHEGPEVVNNRVKYASGTVANLDATRKAGLMGMAMPRRYNGLNFPIVPYIMAADIVSRADAGFENLWGLQDCAETLYEFGSEDQRERFIPRICAGETMSMDLTEPDAGSDLQSVMLKATYSEADGCWLLNGVKRFITNGDADIHLVLARSEEGTKDGRGLSMFIYDKKQGGVNVRRIENKMGIKGSPTCELVYKNAKAELCGDRKLGLIKYVMALMNGARLGIAAQSVGLSQAAYNEALAYAQERMQFGKAIIKFAAVQEILSVMKAKLDASRALLYETARFVDMYKVLEDIQRERKLDPEERTEMKKYSKLADAFTPLAKGLSSEYANQNAYDAIQIHGGSGFMKDYACERIYRDARITSIYEGTTQLQVVAAIRHVTTGTYLAQLRTYAEKSVKPELEPLKTRLIALTDLYEKTVASVVDTKNNEYIDFQARRMVEMAGYLIMSYLLLNDANKDEKLFRKSAEVYLNYTQAEVKKNASFIRNFDIDEMAFYRYDFEEKKVEEEVTA
ncbi:MAG: Acyl-CoA dehydrogenase C-terminal domain-containing protein [Bacteroidales bacterium]